MNKLKLKPKLEGSKMQHYIWFHPNYVQDSDEDLISGQKKDAQRYNYIILTDSELHKVTSSDHLTIVGHTTEPNADEEDEQRDTGSYIQGESAVECIKHLRQLGLRCGPKILSLEACYAGIKEGIAQQLSKDLLFKYSLIEANTHAVGRNYGAIWMLATDYLGRAIINPQKSMWVFYLQGYELQRSAHGSYELGQVLEQLELPQFQQRFFSNYHPGCFGGRVGRYCAKGSPLTLGKALFFAQENTSSATADALDLTLEELYKLK